MDHRADIYSMGAVLFHMASGETPFNADSLLAVLTMIAIDPIPLIHEVCPDANRPNGLDDVIAKAMAKDPADRYQDIRDLANALPPPRDSIGLNIPVSVKRSGVTIDDAARAAQTGPGTAIETPTAHETPMPRDASKEVSTLHNGVFTTTTPVHIKPITHQKPKRFNWIVVGALLVVGVTAGAIAAIAYRLNLDPDVDAPPDSTTQTEAGPNKLDPFDDQMATIQNEMKGENWAAAAGLISSLSKQFPQRDPMLRLMREEVEMEMGSSTFHHRAKVQAATNPKAAQALCTQIEVRSTYRSRPPCDTLLKGLPETKVAKADAGPDARTKEPPTTPKTGPQPLRDVDVQKVVRKNRGATMRCFDRAFGPDFRPVGNITVSVAITIAETGRVTSAKLLDRGHPVKAVFRNCMENKVRNWQFRKARGTHRTQIPFTYRAPDLNLNDIP